MANNMVRFQENMKKLRENPDTSRAGLKWDDSEDENVLSKLKSGMSVDDIARNLLDNLLNLVKYRIVESISSEECINQFSIDFLYFSLNSYAVPNEP